MSKLWSVSINLTVYSLSRVILNYRLTTDGNSIEVDIISPPFDMLTQWMLEIYYTVKYSEFVRGAVEDI